MKGLLSLLLLGCMAGCGTALAEDVKPDGRWRGSGGAALSVSSGNTHNTNLIVTAEAARLTADDKLSLHGQIRGSRVVSNGVTSTTASLWEAGTRYDHNVSLQTFWFGGLDLNHDQIIKLNLRSVISGGIGYHLVKTAGNQWDLFTGAAYRGDRFSGSGVLINNSKRTGLNTGELLLGEESSHKLGESTSFKQSLMLSPNLSSLGGTRATFDAGLLVSMNKTLSLRVKLQYRHDSLSQAPIRNDVNFFTGVNVSFGN